MEYGGIVSIRVAMEAYRVKDARISFGCCHALEQLLGQVGNVDGRIEGQHAGIRRYAGAFDYDTNNGGKTRIVQAYQASRWSVNLLYQASTTGVANVSLSMRRYNYYFFCIDLPISRPMANK